MNTMRNSAFVTWGSVEVIEDGAEEVVLAEATEDEAEDVVLVELR